MSSQAEVAEGETAEEVTCPFSATLTIAPEAALEDINRFLPALRWELKKMHDQALLWWQEGRIEAKRRGIL